MDLVPAFVGLGIGGRSRRGGGVGSGRNLCRREVLLSVVRVADDEAHGEGGARLDRAASSPSPSTSSVARADGKGQTTSDADSDFVDGADLSEVKRLLDDFVRSVGFSPNVMPTDTELRKHGYNGLSKVIMKSGGFPRVADRLGWKRRRVGQVASNTVVVCEDLRKLVVEQGLPLGRMPEKRQIRRINPMLANRIESVPGGGWRKVATILGWEATGRRVKKRGQYQKPSYPPGYFDSPMNLRKELDQFILENPDIEELGKNVMPSYKHLKRKPVLGTVVRRLGGPDRVAVLVNMCCPGDWMYFREFQWLLKSLRDYLSVTVTSGKMPKLCDLKGAGRSELARAIIRHGGTNALGSRLDLEVSQLRKDRLIWGPFCIHFAISVLEAADHLRIVSHSGMIAMPTVAELERLRVRDVAKQMLDFGGEDAVARRLGLAPPIEEPVVIADYCENTDPDGL